MEAKKPSIHTPEMPRQFRSTSEISKPSGVHLSSPYGTMGHTVCSKVSGILALKMESEINKSEEVKQARERIRKLEKELKEVQAQETKLLDKEIGYIELETELEKKPNLPAYETVMQFLRQNIERSALNYRRHSPDSSEVRERMMDEREKLERALERARKEWKMEYDKEKERQNPPWR